MTYTPMGVVRLAHWCTRRVGRRIGISGRRSFVGRRRVLRRSRLGRIKRIKLRRVDHLFHAAHRNDPSVIEFEIDVVALANDRDDVTGDAEIIDAQSADELADHAAGRAQL
ncbi:MAG TPA: hypothetical protein VGB09_13005, partial [Candidatus Binatia bacterium]